MIIALHCFLATGARQAALMGTIHGYTGRIIADRDLKGYLELEERLLILLLSLLLLLLLLLLPLEGIGPCLLGAQSIAVVSIPSERPRHKRQPGRRCKGKNMERSAPHSRDISEGIHSIVPVAEQVCQVCMLAVVLGRPGRRRRLGRRGTLSERRRLSDWHRRRRRRLAELREGVVGPDGRVLRDERGGLLHLLLLLLELLLVRELLLLICLLL